MPRITELWERLEAWGSANAPDMLADLSPGALVDEVADLERTLGISLPETFKESLRVHNGEDDGWPNRAFADRGAYLSCAGIVAEWQGRLDVAREYENPESLPATTVGAARGEMFNEAWIPFLNCNGDVIWALDFAPAEGGTPGQVIEIDWEGCYVRVVAASFEAMFRDYVEALEQGDYEVVDGLPTQQLRMAAEEEARNADREALQKRRDDALYEDIGAASIVLILLALWTVVRMIWVDADVRRWSLLVASLVAVFVIVEAPTMMRRRVTGRRKAQLNMVIPLLLGFYLLAVEGAGKLPQLIGDFTWSGLIAAATYGFAGAVLTWNVAKVYRIRPRQH